MSGGRTNLAQEIQAKEFSAHASVVNDLSYDIEEEYIGRWSDDESVVLMLMKVLSHKLLLQSPLNALKDNYAPFHLRASPAKPVAKLTPVHSSVSAPEVQTPTRRHSIGKE